MPIDKQAEEVLCVLLNEEENQFENWIMLEQLEVYLSNQALESDFV